MASVFSRLYKLIFQCGLSMDKFGRYAMFSEIGFAFQNLVHGILQDKIRYEGSTLHFWRTKDRAEVDFIIRSGDEALPVEVKCKELKDKDIGRSLKSFIKEYNPREAWVINIGLKNKVKVNGTLVRFKTIFDLLSENI